MAVAFADGELNAEELDGVAGGVAFLAPLAPFVPQIITGGCAIIAAWGAAIINKKMR